MGAGKSKRTAPLAGAGLGRQTLDPFLLVVVRLRDGRVGLVAAGGADAFVLVVDTRRDIQRLMDMEAIRQLKYAYFRCVDTCNLEELANLFHDDVAVHFRGGTYEWKFQGKDEYVKNIGMSFSREAVGQHNAQRQEPGEQ